MREAEFSSYVYRAKLTYKSTFSLIKEWLLAALKTILISASVGVLSALGFKGRTPSS
jgi:hypothetical protein